MKSKINSSKVKKPFFKRWWFWLIAAILLISIFGNSEKKSDVGENVGEASSSIEQKENETPVSTPTVESASQVEVSESSGSTSLADDSWDSGISFDVQEVRNDVTGRWRISLIAENIDMENHALDYYNKYFQSNDEIHAIVNFNYMTTTKISVIGNLLDVCVYEYVDKEEHDAKLLFSGTLLKEYHVNIDTGEIQEII